MLAAFLSAQLDDFARIQALRQQRWHTYDAALRSWATDRGVIVPHIPADVDHSAHLYYLLLPSLELRQRFIQHLRSRGIHAVFHYVPLHMSPMGQRLGADQTACPVTRYTSDRLVRLPLFPDLTETDQARVIEAVKAFTLDTGTVAPEPISSEPRLV